MQLSILTIGKMKAGPESELLERYVDRSKKAGRQLGLSGPNLQEWPESKAASSDLRKEEEGKLLASSLKPGALLIALDERGKEISSQDFATILQDGLNNGMPQIAFVIGGADGHSKQLRQEASKTISFGKMTWPHQIARVMLSEQIYRAITILSGHPYHRV